MSNLPMSGARVFALAALAAGVAVMLWLVVARPPMLVDIAIGPMPDDEAWRVLNPFRDRAPERQADAFLASLKDGSCVGTLAAISAAPELEASEFEAVCQRERRWPLERWRLERRHDGSEGADLEYRYIRQDVPREGRLFVSVLRDGGEWKVWLYKSVY